MIPANVTRNHVFVVLCVMLVYTAFTSQMACAKNISTQRPSLAVSSTTNQISMTELSRSSAPTTRIFNIFTTDVPGFNETKGVQKANLTSDQYSLQTILVNQGDKVVVNLYNMEAPSGDMHSFTIDAPYNVDIDTTPGQDGTATFVADHPGIFKFYCKHHLPGMNSI
jgi:nitrous oxide reductase